MTEQCLSNLELDRHLAGEIGASDHLSSCASCRERMAAFEQDKRELEQGAPQAVLAIEQRARTRAVRTIVPVSIAALAAGVLIALAVPAPPDLVRTKGGLSLEVIARRGERAPIELLPGGEVAPGDAIRFRITSDQGGYLAISGLDSA